MNEKEKTPNSVKICSYSLLALALFLYFVAHWYDGAFYAFLGYIFFSDWASDVVFKF